VASTENFVVVQVNGRTARVEGKTPDGQSLDITQLESSTVAEAPSR